MALSLKALWFDKALRNSSSAVFLVKERVFAGRERVWTLAVLLVVSILSEVRWMIFVDISVRCAVYFLHSFVWTVLSNDNHLFHDLNIEQDTIVIYRWR